MPMLSLRANELDMSTVSEFMLFDVVSSEDKEVSSANAKFIKILNSNNQRTTIKQL
jgi:hypothetical protein